MTLKIKQPCKFLNVLVVKIPFAANIWNNRLKKATYFNLQAFKINVLVQYTE